MQISVDCYGLPQLKFRLERLLTWPWLDVIKIAQINTNTVSICNQNTMHLRPCPYALMGGVQEKTILQVNIRGRHSNTTYKGERGAKSCGHLKRSICSCPCITFCCIPAFILLSPLLFIPPVRCRDSFI